MAPAMPGIADILNAIGVEVFPDEVPEAGELPDRSSCPDRRRWAAADLGPGVPGGKLGLSVPGG